MKKNKEKLKQFINKQRTEQRQVWYLPKHIILEEFQSRKYLVYTSLSICCVILSLIIWSALATVDEKSVTQGELIPIGRVKIVQHLEGGIVEKVLVENNSIVEAGTPIVQLSSTAYEAELKQLKAQQTSLSIDAQRLQAFINNEDSLEDKSHIHNIDELALLNQENQLLSIQNKARNDQLEILEAQIKSQREEIIRLSDQIKSTEENLQLLNQEVNMYEELAKDGYVSKREYLQALRTRNTGNSELASLKQQLKQADQKLVEIMQSKQSTESNLHQEASRQLDDIRSELNEVIYKIERLQDKVERTTIRAPVAGVVKGLEVTVGQVVAQGGEVFTLVPKNEMLQAEIKIEPKDIAHVNVDDPVIVKVMAYDFARYGSIKGKISAISATSFKDQKGNPYYKGIVALNSQYVNNEKNKLKAGMTLEADVITSQKTILEYLLKPIHTTLTSSFYER
ncbi:HlyD family type I secretion periplasmic adaptor subunit [Thiotrichales bacterium 19S9-12]|nr:HlyD family type I secretion periplasmic adaptor subunit [Thiotrichales bacterium 19S9-11]MCF6811986.1 HlyD family type I secretion periplasmic adaptor subunit [Thiotrichales bacterium 19S9-12]